MEPSTDLLSKRFKVAHLQQLYNEFRYFAFEHYLDAQTFVHLMVLAIKENRVPASWRFYNFSKINSIVKAFAVRPTGLE